jgi:carboxyl-terminal processing protease
MQEYGRSIVLGALAGVLLAVVFAAGFFARDLLDIRPILSVGQRDQSYPLLDEVDRLLELHYLRPIPDYTVRQYEAVRGMLRSLNDPNTFFIDPPVAQSESDALAGTYGGIGVGLQRGTNGEFVLLPFDDSPAEKAGIADGDILLAVNGGAITPDMQQDAVDQMLRGEVRDGNGVELTVRREDGQSFSAFIPFGVINVPSVLWRVLPEAREIGYLQLVRFTNRTPQELQDGLNALRAEGISALILDVRNNGGGLLQEAVDVADELLSEAVVLYQRSKNGEETYRTTEGGAMVDLPMVVLVNGGTASAAELVAGAIADNERGILIGQKTFGKGTIQQIYKLSDASSVHITSAEWFTPKRFALDGQGLTPALEVVSDPQGDAELAAAIAYLQGAPTSSSQP